MDIQMKPRSFESKILFMNGMYQLPTAPYPTTQFAQKWQLAQKPNLDITGNNAAIVDRLKDLKKILQDELNEMDDILSKLESNSYPTEIDFLTDVTDLMHDITIYCQSELARFGIPLKETMSIIMASNFSKLDAAGKPIIKDGKFEKGPFYWKPEPQIKEFLLKTVQEIGQDKFEF